MIDIIQNKIERAVLVAARTRFISRDVLDEHLDELEELSKTAGVEIVDKVTQDRDNFDSSFYIGKGKAQELAQFVEDNAVDLLIFDDDLTPGQVRNLEELVKRKIIDRSGLILDIFASHAKTRTARTQVELAQLQYMLPRLTRAWTHLSKQFGGVGTKGPGETQIETDRRLIRDRIAFLKRKLIEIEADRSTQTKGRKEWTKATLVGYTNAGKSTLFNLLSGAEALAEDKLFATLDSTTRNFLLRKNTEILLSDTVGFIRKLPHHLVASFKSTLSEVREADLILHVIDMTHPFYEDHIRVVTQTLEELGCKEKPSLMVFNKVDGVDDRSKIEFIQNHYPDSVIVSAVKGFNITALKERIEKFVESTYQIYELTLDTQKSYLIQRAKAMAETVDEQYIEDKVHVKFRVRKSEVGKLELVLQGK
jgi:GTP-binding protein HflX